MSDRELNKEQYCKKLVNLLMSEFDTDERSAREIAHLAHEARIELPEHRLGDSYRPISGLESPEFILEKMKESGQESVSAKWNWAIGYMSFPVGVPQDDYQL